MYTNEQSNDHSLSGRRFTPSALIDLHDLTRHIWNYVHNAEAVFIL